MEGRFAPGPHIPAAPSARHPPARCPTSLADARSIGSFPGMSEFRIGQAATLLGVSGDTVRRWADEGRLAYSRTEAGRRLIDGADLARFASENAVALEPRSLFAQSTRNRLTGLITKVVKEGVCAQVELQAGPFRLVSLITREAAEELGLEPGKLAVAAIKATNVVVELPRES